MIKPGIGIIGVGHLGRLHAKILSESDKCNLTGIYDKDNQRAQQVGKEIGVSVYTDPVKLIADSDGISIVSTTSTHFEIAKKFYSGLLGIFCRDYFEGAKKCLGVIICCD